MNREQVIAWAREAWRQTGENWVVPHWFDERAASFERFATLVVAAERDRIITENAPEIERINAYIKALEEAVAAERENFVRIVNDNTDVGGDCCAEDLLAAIRAKEEK